MVNTNLTRRFLAGPRGLPGPVLETSTLRTGYLPDTGRWTMRLDRSTTETRFSFDSQEFLPGDRWNATVTESEADPLWALTQGRRLEWDRSVVQWKRRLVAIDRHRGALDGLTLMEIAADPEPLNLVAPSWGPEVTYDPRFSHRRLAENPESVPKSLPSRDASAWAYGVVPYREKGGAWQILAVSTRHQDRWIVPKGRPETRLKFDQVALLEAWEEAGVRGRVTGHPLLLPYARETTVMNLVLYPLLVTDIADTWPESRERDRQWVDLGEAAQWSDVLGWASRWVADQAV